jgi:hypothetical protein
VNKKSSQQLPFFLNRGFLTFDLQQLLFRYVLYEGCLALNADSTESRSLFWMKNEECTESTKPTANLSFLFPPIERVFFSCPLHISPASFQPKTWRTCLGNVQSTPEYPILVFGRVAFDK